MKDQFNSDYCSVKYLKEHNIVFLKWKKFACFDNYREPTWFAYELLDNYEGSNYIVDARNGFEDDKADVKWGFEKLLPAMSKTDCKCVVFILNEVNEIEEEMDLWTKEFLKYFKVLKVTSYEDAVNKIKEM